MKPRIHRLITLAAAFFGFSLHAFAADCRWNTTADVFNDPNTQYFRLKNFNHLQESPQTPWNFSCTPKMVVILLGQNDQCVNAPSVAFTDSYIASVRNIRTKFPNALIVMMRTFGGPYRLEIAAAATALRQGDPKVHYVDTTGWLGEEYFIDGIPPNNGDHLKAAPQLANTLAPILSVS